MVASGDLISIMHFAKSVEVIAVICEDVLDLSVLKKVS